MREILRELVRGVCVCVCLCMYVCVCMFIRVYPVCGYVDIYELPLLLTGETTHTHAPPDGSIFPHPLLAWLATLMYNFVHCRCRSAHIVHPHTGYTVVYHGLYSLSRYTPVKRV